MREEELEIRKLKEDLTEFIAELSKIAALPQDRLSGAMQLCEQHFAHLPERIRDAIVYRHCTFVERRVEDEWRYLLQHGDFMVCDCIPSYMRNLIVNPIVQYLTPLGKASEIIWYRMS